MEEKQTEEIQNEEKVAAKKKRNIVKRILDSASFAMLLSIAFFAYEMNSGAQETKEIVNNLTQIQNSLSTRYLGIFPEYIGNINKLFDEAIINRANDGSGDDKVVICQDVLYYGIRSDSKGFRKMLNNILHLAESGCDMTIAYYNADGFPFKSMIKSGQLSLQGQQQYRHDMQEYLKRLRVVEDTLRSVPNSNPNKATIVGKVIDEQFDGYRSKHAELSTPMVFSKLSDKRMVDSIVCEQYFKQSVASDKRKFEAQIEELKRPIPIIKYANANVSKRVGELCKQLDSIKLAYLDKPYEKICYADIHNMYRDITYAIQDILKPYNNVKLIALNEHLTMSCWLTIVNGQETAIIAFPSKYSTDEIGFISQDVAFARYIQTMLRGMRISHDVQ